MNCEMCGTSGELLRAVIEDAELKVCSNCSMFGKVIGKVMTAMPDKHEKHLPKKDEKILAIVENYGGLIKQKREQLKLSQKDFAKKLAVKESLIRKIEVGAVEPDIELALKLEKLMGLKLIKEKEEETITIPKTKMDELTVGDFIKVRKK